MSYSIEALEKEKYLISKCLNKGDWEKYPESNRRQEKKIKDLDRGIAILKNKSCETSICKNCNSEVTPIATGNMCPKCTCDM